MSLHLFGAQISNTLWRLAFQNRGDGGDVLCLKSGSKGIFAACRSAVSFLYSAVSKLSKDFASWLCLHHSNTLPLRVQNVHSQAMVLSSTSVIYLYHSTTPYLCVQMSDTNAHVAVSTNTSKLHLGFCHISRICSKPLELSVAALKHLHFSGLTL